MVEESWQDVEYRRFRKYQFLWGTGEEKQTEHEQTDHKLGRSSRHKKAVAIIVAVRSSKAGNSFAHSLGRWGNEGCGVTVVRTRPQL